jgi:tetratricopeptide (TPR) repeat protein
MKRLIPCLLLLPALHLSAQVGAAPPPPQADSGTSSRQDGFLAHQRDEESRLSGLHERAPDLDPNRIINESNNFLKNREPEMTASEYALYEKISAMLSVRPEFALTLLEGMMRDGEKHSPAFALMLGNAYFALKHNDKAESSYRESLAGYPEFERAWSNLGVLYYSQEKYAEAARCFSKTVSLGDRSPSTFGLLGYCLERIGNSVGAEAAYLQAVAGDMEQTDWTEGLLRVYQDGRQYSRAEPLVKQLMRVKPRDGRYWSAYANILAGMDRKLEAAACLETARSLGVADDSMLLFLGDLFAEQNLAPEAMEAFGAVSAGSGQLGQERLLRLARLQQGQHHYDEAGRALELAAAKADPAMLARVRLARAELLVARGSLAEARAQLEELAREQPANGQLQLSLGKVYQGLGDDSRAAFALEAAAAVPATAYPALLELANLELRGHHYARSAEHARRAYGLERSSALAQFITQVSALSEDATPSSP